MFLTFVMGRLPSLGGWRETPSKPVQSALAIAVESHHRGKLVREDRGKRRLVAKVVTHHPGQPRMASCVVVML